ncbi:dipeptidase [Melioribacteraceae bacterium 4301-Me]|uniref:dipeptidase n=1 Tax=Pyranulibacter aquaticus TaxID=3163344 RepID=UPI00359BF37D
MEEVINYINSNFNNYLTELKEYLRIKSVSALESYKDEVAKCAEFAAQKLKDAGMKRVEIFKTDGNPIVYGEWLEAQGKPTVLIYGHYDVQPVDPIELWKSDPFEAEIRDGKIYARGANDNKGQHFVHIKSVEAFYKVTGKLPVNVKFILEGEEEVGSVSITKFIKEHKDLLKCDAVLISDTSMYAEDVPTISYGLRGLCYLEVQVTGPSKDLHSGSFGGAVANPINELAKIIAKLHDKNGKITIPGFYKNVMKLTAQEKENLKKLRFSDKELAKQVGVKELSGEKGYSTLERLWSRPTLDCNGIVGGFIEDGAKTIIPSKASAKISMRLVPNQNPKEIQREFIKYVKSLAPKSITVDFKIHHYGYPVVIDLNTKAIKAASNALSKAFGKKTVYTREGGSIPIVVDFVKELKSPVVLMGLGLDTDDIHSPNEHFHIKNFERGILSSAYFFGEFGG